MSETRLNAFLARSGVTSRRGADRLIATGSVLVNGRVPPPDGVMVDPARDRVTVDGRTVKPMTEYRYLMLNKPLGVITTAKDDAGRTSVLDVLGDEARAAMTSRGCAQAWSWTTASPHRPRRTCCVCFPGRPQRCAWSSARVGTARYGACWKRSAIGCTRSTELRSDRFVSAA